MTLKRRLIESVLAAQEGSAGNYANGTNLKNGIVYGAGRLITLGKQSKRLIVCNVPARNVLPLILATLAQVLKRKGST